MQAGNLKHSNLRGILKATLLPTFIADILEQMRHESGHEKTDRHIDSPAVIHFIR